MKYILPVFVLGLVLQSCEEECDRRNVTCLAYQEKGAATWLPYKANDRIIFSRASAFDTITIKTVNETEVYEATVSGRNPYCHAEKTWRSSEAADINGSPKLNIYIYQQTNMYRSEETESVGILFKRTSFGGKGFSDTGLIKNSFYQKSQYLPSEVLGGKTFQFVQMIVADTVTQKSPAVSKIWISKNNGIVAYEESATGNLWVKQ